MRLLFFLSISIMLFATKAKSENQYGLFMVVKGDVKVISGTKAPFPVKVGSKVMVGDVVTTGVDSRAKVVMADRNVINISPDSRMQINKYSTDSKTGAKEVEIKLDQGKIRNNVEQSYDGEKSKFILKTPTAVAGVRGTQFVTSFDSKTQKTSIVTMKGQVTFASVLNGKVVGKPVVVNKGESTTSSAGAPPEAPKAVPKSELKEMDKDSTAASKSKNEPVADNGKPEGNKAGEGPKDGPNDGTKREPASVNPNADGSMVRPDDISGVKPPMMDGMAPAGQPQTDNRPPLPKLPPVPRPPNPFVNPVGKTKLIITPQ